MILMLIIGGTGSLTLANHLADTGSQTVLVFEAGSEPGVIAASKSPLGSALVLGHIINSPLNHLF